MIIAADNLQITNQTIERAIKEMDPAPIQEIVRRCEDAGADIIDINPGPLTRDGAEKMAFLVDAVQQVTDLPLCLDTANPAAMESGIKSCKGQVIINGFSLQQEKLAIMLPLAQRYDCDIIGFLLLPNGQVPTDANGRLSAAVRLLEECVKAGLEPSRLIIDPVIIPITWDTGHHQALAVLSVLKMLPELLGFKVRTIAGLSNFTAGRGPREQKLLLEEVYLSMLAAAGLTIALINVLHAGTIRVAKACDAITSAKVFAWEDVS